MHATVLLAIVQDSGNMGQSMRPCNMTCVALASAALWMAVTFAAHVLSSTLSAKYQLMRIGEKVQWCNRIASGLHVSLLKSHTALALQIFWLWMKTAC